MMLRSKWFESLVAQSSEGKERPVLRYNFFFLFEVLSIRCFALLGPRVYVSLRRKVYFDLSGTGFSPFRGL